MSRIASGARTAKSRHGVHPVSHPHDPAERQAQKAAEVIARGGSVTGWSFSSVRTDASGAGVVHREAAGKPKPEDKKKEALAKAAEAALASPAGKKLQEKILDEPAVRKLKAAASTPAGIAVIAGAIAGGVGGLAAAGKELPFQAPEIPLDVITPGLSAKVTVEGPLNAPTRAGLMLTYKEQGAAKPKGPSESERLRAETARLAAGQAAFRAGLKFAPGSKEAQQERAEQEAIARFVASQSTLPGVGRPLIPLIPLTGGPVLTTTPGAAEPEKKKDDTPVQREPVPVAGTAPDTGFDAIGVEAAVSGGGRPLEAPVRRSMEARFGVDFRTVRVHDDVAAAAAAADVHAKAFTLGSDIAFAPGAYDPASPQGRHLLAHELAHVVQQREAPVAARGTGGAAPIHRLGIGEMLARIFGGGTFTDEELQNYLALIRRSGEIEDAYDSDNKAREIVRRFTAGTGYTTLTVPDRVLLIREMLSGYTSGADERAILDLLYESIPAERKAIITQVGYHLLRSNFSGDNLMALKETVESANEDLALTGEKWTVEGVLRIINRHGDEQAIQDMLDRGYTVMRFETVFDKWRYADGHVEEKETTEVFGTTLRPQRQIRIRDDLTDDEAATTLFHEIRHAVTAAVPTTTDEKLEEEIAVRVATEEFLIRHGMPPWEEGYRKPDGTIDEAFIRAQIYGSPHYNPQGRQHIGRRYVLLPEPTRGWHTPPARRPRSGP